MAKSETKRIQYIDCLKGFAILLVVIGHIFDGYIRAGYFSEYRNFMCGGYNLIYSFHMALFFLISGFVYRKAYFTASGEKKPKMKLQIFNILIIYFVFSVLFGLFKMLVGKYTNGDVSFMDILLIGIKAIYPYWYLYVMLIYYILFSVKVVYKLPIYIQVFILFGVSFISNFVSGAISSYFEIKHIMYYLLFFGLGIIIAIHYDKYQKYELWISVFTFVVSLIIIVIDRVGYTYDDFHSGLLLWNRKYNFIIALGIVLFLLYLFRILFSKNEAIHVKFFSFLGRYSLEIYVIHCVFTAGNRVILQKLNIDNFYLNIILNTIISTALPVLISYICQKINIHKMIFQPAVYLSERSYKHEV